ncbi:hypothetical protein DH2020_032028 [Rehmannia glutinosa]|uniref:S-adenosylmethionine-dependent methyltransferase n=1 Tax=Rehmannia glutinosa TaxID=99300 RepID=A0ABR0VI26_REHGL
MASIIGPHIHKRALLKHTVALNAMNDGDGPNSYFQNSSYQGGAVDVTKPIIEEEIATKLDDVVQHLASTFYIADFGCSTGRNSFPAIQFITQAIKQKLKTSSPKIPEFQVLFNDVVTNDFNTLFASLPRDRLYRAAAVPGDFHGRLLPESSLHFGYSSWSLQWLTEVPKAVADRDSPAWNRGRVYCTRERKDVCDAYLNQFGDEVESFLEARAVEMVSGGLMAIVVPGEPEFWNPETEFTIPSEINLFGSCLMDMAKKGRFSESKVDSFNFPFYLPTSQQLKVILERSQSFSIERMEVLNNPGKYTLPSVDARAVVYRAVLGRLLTDHFGSEIMDELFELYTKKIAASPIFQNPDNDKTTTILVVLKPKTD